jgi:hypothetical protein
MIRQREQGTNARDTRCETSLSGFVSHDELILAE